MTTRRLIGPVDRRQVLSAGAGLAAASLLPGCAGLQGAAGGADAPVLSKIAFGSCIHQDRPAPVLASILERDPQLMLFLGDNVYGDDKPGNEGLTLLEAAYAQQKARPELQALRARVPVMATWDDHDYGLNDAGGEFPYKDKAQRLFADFWDLPADDPRRSRPGVYSAAIYGPAGRRVQVILLDTRYFRSTLERTAEGSRWPYENSGDTAKTLLGETQWAWFADQLRQPAEVRVIASSIQIIADGHGWEKWGNIEPERERFFETVRASGATGVVLVSGDRHSAALYRLSGAVGYPLHEATSSSLNLAFLEGRDIDEPGVHRLTGMYTGANFGTVTVDWDDRMIMMDIYDDEGMRVQGHLVPFDEIGAG